MANQPTNQLVDRIVRILSKKHADTIDFSKIGEIKVSAFDNEMSMNIHPYNPSSIESFFTAYEEAMIDYAVNKFVYIGVFEMFKYERYL